MLTIEERLEQIAARETSRRWFERYGNRAVIRRAANGPWPCWWIINARKEYWNNACGWVNEKVDATAFSPHERAALRLPIGDCHWIE